ncbi:MAG: D-glycero-D-manno-heptose 1-phosphate guanosyltransferase [Chlamydiae bacterium CG10_big_fil_rev_8_21_14_0_10_35_9]|nr:MAG: D-glycero-D-manno-heptose 1-phosphate guanosyltransferase [Chlamydiae bacterium CG10_big_fil_rev_8_21_14_0_10_35_9]
MDCIILAGGLGTRLKSKVPDLPKALAPINGTPFLEILLQRLSHSSLVKRVIFSIGYKGSMIQQYIASKSYPFECVFSLEDTPLGTGGATFHALEQTNSSTVFVMNGDSYFNICLSSFFDFHQKNSADITIACLKAEDSSRFGSIEISSEKRILSFKEKSNNSSLINGGIYCINKEVFLSLPFQKSFSLEHDAFPHLIKHKMFAYISPEDFIDIGTEESYMQAQKFLKPLVTT